LQYFAFSVLPQLHLRRIRAGAWGFTATVVASLGLLRKWCESPYRGGNFQAHAMP
jgi:hypothetical protein